MVHKLPVWKKFILSVNKMYVVLDKYSIDTKIDPVFNDKEITFNGIGDDSHETFCIDRVITLKKLKDFNDEYAIGQWKRGKKHYSFCKTARKPYDFFVKIVLLLYMHYFKVAVSWDGDWDEAMRALVAIWNELKILPMNQDELVKHVATCNEESLKDVWKKVLSAVVNNKSIEMRSIFNKKFNGTAEE